MSLVQIYLDAVTHQVITSAELAFMAGTVGSMLSKSSARLEQLISVGSISVGSVDSGRDVRNNFSRSGLMTHVLPAAERICCPRVILPHSAPRTPSCTSTRAVIHAST